MGKRKSSRKVVKKERPKLDTVFACLFCNHESSVTVTMDKEHNVGNLRCKICTAAYQASINNLSAPVDVYSEWIDACEEAKLAEIRKNTADGDGGTEAGGRQGGAAGDRQDGSSGGRQERTAGDRQDGASDGRKGGASGTRQGGASSGRRDAAFSDSDSERSAQSEGEFEDF